MGNLFRNAHESLPAYRPSAIEPPHQKGPLRVKGGGPAMSSACLVICNFGQASASACLPDAFVQTKKKRFGTGVCPEPLAPQVGEREPLYKPFHAGIVTLSCSHCYARPGCSACVSQIHRAFICRSAQAALVRDGDGWARSERRCAAPGRRADRCALEVPTRRAWVAGRYISFAAPSDARRKRNRLRPPRQLLWAVRLIVHRAESHPETRPHFENEIAAQLGDLGMMRDQFSRGETILNANVLHAFVHIAHQQIFKNLGSARDHLVIIHRRHWSPPMQKRRQGKAEKTPAAALVRLPARTGKPSHTTKVGGGIRWRCMTAAVVPAPAIGGIASAVRSIILASPVR